MINKRIVIYAFFFLEKTWTNVIDTVGIKSILEVVVIIWNLSAE